MNEEEAKAGEEKKRKLFSFRRFIPANRFLMVRNAFRYNFFVAMIIKLLK